MDYSHVLTHEEVNRLQNERNQLTGKNASAGDRAIWQNRVKKAHEAYVAVKAAFDEGLDIENLPGAELDEGLTAEEMEGSSTEVPKCPEWPAFRDAFILDWMSNRIIVTEEEANTMIENEVNSALQVIEAAEAAAASSTPIVTEPSVVEPAAPAVEPVVEAPAKRRGRPAGSGKKIVKAAVAKAKSKRAVKRKGKAKKAVVRKTGGSKSAKAQNLIEKFAARDWSRKDIIVKLQKQLDIGVAYAATLYQKFA